MHRYKIIGHPLFVLGACIKLALLFFASSQAELDWYLPFLNLSLENLSLNPWGVHLAGGGDAHAFPYGLTMWFAFIPLAGLAKLLGLPLSWGYGLTIFIFDCAALFLMLRIFSLPAKKILNFYWLSPIVLFACYWLKLNDIVPVCALLLSLYALKKLHINTSAIFLAIAISMKLSMAIALPFFLIYLIRNKILNGYFLRFCLSGGAALSLFCLPQWLSTAGRNMLMYNPELSKIYDISIGSASTPTIYLLPLILLFMLYFMWSMRRVNFEILFIQLGIALFSVLVLTPASPGWFLWVVPLLAYYQSVSDRVTFLVVTLFSAVYVGLSFLLMPQPLVFGSTIVEHFRTALNGLLSPQLLGLVHTLLIGLGVILIYRIWKNLIYQNTFYRMTRKPIVIGIAGDSGAGKDTLVSDLAGLLGNRSCIAISGDDYHLWDRQKPMWQVMTHLNPRANDLARFTRDLQSLVAKKMISIRHYCHKTGKMSKPFRLKSNDFIFASGLHALYTQSLRKRYDLSIYLDIDENLRKFFKIQRDTTQRGHSVEKILNSIAAREPDSKKFIRPQSKHADLVIALQAIHPELLENHTVNSMPRYKLKCTIRNGIDIQALVRVLIGTLGYHVELLGERDSMQEIVIEGDANKDDLAMAANILFSNIQDLLDKQPRWQDGMQGIAQLVVLFYLEQTLRERLL